MTRYILKRLGYSLITLWVIVTLTFILMHLLPGKPFTGAKPIPPAIEENLNRRYGLDQPLHVQYAKYVGNLLKGDLGMSMFQQNRSVNSIIADGFPVSASLGIRALIFALTAGLLLGIVASINHGKTWDYFTMFVAVLGVSVPSFIIGGIIQYIFGVKPFRILPVAGWNGFKYTIMPSFALGLGTLAVMARMMRASMLDVLNQDYIKTAKAKGLPRKTIIWRHAIRNAILPVVTILGPLVASITTGTFVVENIFGIPGLGKHFVNSVNQNDYTLIMGLTLFYAILLIGMNFIVDIAYGFIDPRIRLVREKE
ncbi:ABC transporter permease [Mahella australiensis]|uniref:Binding-protein-dependent transport systems inner membrane component n=1 Tax=Mahella australiensis (strain DSM 15567 / CIP 107919 / 50-1 BON) TaxID=697281 RepID=F3ZYH2_MAHA5|nr:ABC transporter permease [Mahella australiensis]AEE96714.1 binding-protein-dependent transport systems inner membrane component [Mahella australiensis 50-1 BON]